MPVPSGEAEFLSRLWLHEPTAGDVERAVRELSFPRAEPADLAIAFADLFLLNVFPYGSAFTDHDGELNGLSAQLASAAFERVGFRRPELDAVAGADHLGLCLASMSGCADFADRADETWCEFAEDLLGWGPVCCLAVEREPGVHPFYVALAERTRDLLLTHADHYGGDAVVQSVEEPVADEPGDDEVRLHDLVSFILAPARCGVFISRGRLGHMARALGMRLPFGSRYEVARGLFTAAGEAGRVEELLDLLEAEVVEWQMSLRNVFAEHSFWTTCGGNWERRCSETLRWVVQLRTAVNGPRV